LRAISLVGASPLGARVRILMLLMLGLGVTGFMLEAIDYFWGEDLPLSMIIGKRRKLEP